MASIAELQDALVNADKAGDAAAARQLADAIHAMRSTQDAMPAAVKAGQQIGGIGRQLGLTARYGLEGLAQVAQIGTEPLRYLTDKVTGGNSKPLSGVASDLADLIGLPKPQGANERVIGDATRLVAGAGGLGTVGRVAQGGAGVMRSAGDMLANNLGQQALAAGGAGLAGGSVREAGGGEGAQALAALLGGVATPMAAQGAARAANAVRTAVTPRPGLQNVDQRIELIMRQQGIDWSQIPERIKQPMRAEVQQALNTNNQVNPDAIRRLLDFKTVGATPTRGMLTQDPVQITKEMNLAKTGANSTDMLLQRLPQLQSQNTGTLLGGLDNLGAKNAPDAFSTGQKVLDALNRNITASKNDIGVLYSAARDTSGRSAPLNGFEFTSKASQALDEALLGGALPPSVSAHLNKIAQGEVPFTVDYAEQLKTAIGKLQRATSDGQTRMALGVVRGALDDTSLLAAKQVNPGNLPAVPGTVPPSPATLGAQSIEAFNKARAANRAFMQRVEETPALAAAIDGAEPDRFVQQFLIGQGATVKDVQALKDAAAGSPEALQAIKANIVGHLKNAATNGTEDVNKFSPAAYNKALNNIGERKLAAFFDNEEIRQLQAIGRVGTLMNAQPAGSAVNNSNSGALLIGRAMTALDSVAGKLPLGLDNMIQGTMRGVQQGQALNVPRSLLLDAPVKRLGLLERLGAPAIFGGLLATQPVD
jgi:hypothetical protein